MGFEIVGVFASVATIAKLGVIAYKSKFFESKSKKRKRKIDKMTNELIGK